MYGFYDECKRRTNVKIWKTFVDVFNALPIVALVAGKIFCVHGGLSPSLQSLDDVRNIMRPTDVPEYGLLNDLLWSDPSDTALEWEDNERGVSYCFGKRVVNDFLAKHDLDLVCRAHMVVEDGYEFFNDRTLVTVFSAPNYCGEFDNFGAIMSINEELLCSFELLTPTEHPPARVTAINRAAAAKGERRPRYILFVHFKRDILFKLTYLFCLFFFLCTALRCWIHCRHRKSKVHNPDHLLFVFFIFV